MRYGNRHSTDSDFWASERTFCSQQVHFPDFVPEKRPIEWLFSSRVLEFVSEGAGNPEVLWECVFLISAESVQCIEQRGWLKRERFHCWRHGSGIAPLTWREQKNWNYGWNTCKWEKLAWCGRYLSGITFVDNLATTSSNDLLRWRYQQLFLAFLSCVQAFIMFRCLIPLNITICQPLHWFIFLIIQYQDLYFIFYSPYNLISFRFNII